MIKINKSNKSIIAILLLTLIMSQNLNAFGLWRKMRTCRHIKSCFYTANQYYLFYAKILQGFMVLHLAKFLTRYMRSRVRSNIALSNGFYSSPLIFFPAYKTRPPYPNYRRSRYRHLEATKRLLESHEKTDEEMKASFTEEDLNSHSERISKTKDMSSAVKLACEGVKIDSEFFKGGFEIISVYYKVHLKKIHFLETGENRPIQYFDLDCFEKKEDLELADESHLSTVQKIMYEDELEDNFANLIRSFDILSIKEPKEMKNVPEMEFDGTLYKAGSNTNNSSFSSNEINSLKTDREIESIIESVF